MPYLTPPHTDLPYPLAGLLAPLGPEALQRLRCAAQAASRLPLARAQCHAQEEAAGDTDLALLDRELASLLAAREACRAWAERMAAQEGHSALNPAQFLRAWSDSTGRVIQLLKARRELTSVGAEDALLEAVYAELEAELLQASAPHLPEEPAP